MPSTLNRRTLLGLLALPALPSVASMAEPATALMPLNSRTPDPMLPYVQSVVRLALQQAGSSTRLEMLEMEFSQGRSLMELGRGRSPVDLIWSTTDRARERSGLIAIRIPIDRGLLGWRLLLVRATDLPRWQTVNSLNDLRRYTAGQASDWPDTGILAANKLPVVTSNGHEALFRMLAAGRFDYFPRSILEIDAELAERKRPDLAIAPGLMLHYPAAAYLFVSPRRPQLAAELQRGLHAIVADGSLARRHLEHFGSVIRSHPVAPERVLRLDNPLLPPETPLSRRELWLQPGA